MGWAPGLLDSRSDARRTILWRGWAGLPAAAGSSPPMRAALTPVGAPATHRDASEAAAVCRTRWYSARGAPGTAAWIASLKLLSKRWEILWDCRGRRGEQGEGWLSTN